MDVETASPTLTLFSAVLARPAIAVSHQTSYALPFRRVLPRGNSTLPCRISRAEIEPDMGLTGASARDAEAFQLVKDCVIPNAYLSRDVSGGSLFLYVFSLQPSTIVPMAAREIVSGHIAVPAVHSPIPKCLFVTTATAERRCSDRHVADWLMALPAITCCRAIVARSYTMLCKMMIDSSGRNAELTTQRFRSAPTAIRERRDIALGKIARLGLRQLSMGIAFGHEGGDARLCVSCG
jgi:hypothetical protein